MKTYRVDCQWSLVGCYTIEASTEEEAIQLANELPLPDGDYLDGSFDIDCVEEEKPIALAVVE